MPKLRTLMTTGLLLAGLFGTSVTSADAAHNRGHRGAVRAGAHKVIRVSADGRVARNSLSGSVVDQARKPIPGAFVTVEALPLVEGVSPRYFLATDERGRWTTGSIPVGRYIVSVEGTDALAGVWYPNARSAASATALTIRDGKAVTNIVMQLKRTRGPIALTGAGAPTIVNGNAQIPLDGTGLSPIRDGFRAYLTVDGESFGASFYVAYNSDVRLTGHWAGATSGTYGVRIEWSTADGSTQQSGCDACIVIPEP